MLCAKCVTEDGNERKDDIGDAGEKIGRGVKLCSSLPLLLLS